MSLKNYYFPSMKALRLGRIDKFLFHNGQFEQILSVFPNLIQFHLTVDQCQTSNETIDFAKLATYFHQQLKQLKILNFQIYMWYPVYKQEFKVYAELHPVFRCFYRSQSLLLITSYEFRSNYRSQKYVRPS